MSGRKQHPIADGAIDDGTIAELVVETGLDGPKRRTLLREKIEGARRWELHVQRHVMTTGDAIVELQQVAAAAEWLRTSLARLSPATENLLMRSLITIGFPPDSGIASLTGIDPQTGAAIGGMPWGPGAIGFAAAEVVRSIRASDDRGDLLTQRDQSGGNRAEEFAANMVEFYEAGGRKLSIGTREHAKDPDGITRAGYRSAGADWVRKTLRLVWPGLTTGEGNAALKYAVAARKSRRSGFGSYEIGENGNLVRRKPTS